MPKNFGTPFVRLSMGGPLYAAEQWSINLSLIEFTDESGGEVPTSAQLLAVRDAWQTHLAPLTTTNVALRWIKAARIGADGLYPSGHVPTQEAWPTGYTGAGAGNLHAPQVALAATLLGANPRGPAGNGRFFLPLPNFAVSNDGRITQANAQTAANGVAAFINAVNAAVTAEVGIVGPQTPSGRAPARQVVTQVGVGRVLDTIRSRRASFPEERVLAATGITT